MLHFVCVMHAYTDQYISYTCSALHRFPDKMLVAVRTLGHSVISLSPLKSVHN